MEAGATGTSPEIVDDRISALRSALRKAPPKRVASSPTKTAVTQLLPDLLAFRAKGYNDDEIAKIMRDHGFAIAARTLKRYISDARKRSGAECKSKEMKAKTASAQTDGSADIISRATVCNPLTPKTLARTGRHAKDILGHRFDDDV